MCNIDTDENRGATDLHDVAGFKSNQMKNDTKMNDMSFT
jgi:hypothetical protein